VRFTVDLRQRTLDVEVDGTRETVDLYSPRGFEVLSRAWLTVGWSLKYSYQFTWLGRPIIQLPEDMVRLQELVYQVRPDVIVETGVAHGGNQVFLASLCRLMGHGRVIGIDIEIRPHNRAALEAHELRSLITLIEGSSTDPAVVQRVAAAMGSPDKVLIVLDANHTKEHVLAELEAYAHLVGPGSHIIVADGIMDQLAAAPRGRPEWVVDNPRHAVREFLRRHPEFEPMDPPRPFDESRVETPITYWPEGYLCRRSGSCSRTAACSGG
jgi:cephalosporin hydroxylase